MEAATVFEQGPLHPRMKAHSSEITPPHPIVVVYPSEPGEYPLVIFFPGFVIPNTWYTTIFQHIASHGYIIVAPQMYAIPQEDATQEISEAVKLTEWLPTGLGFYLPDDVRPDFQKMVVAGHSRGGKVAFGAVLCRSPATRSSSVKAIIGVDPVDGREIGVQTPPPILTFKPHSFMQGVPVLVVGSGTPHQKMSPDGLNHWNFFGECSAPAYHFVVTNCGHLDFLDENSVIDFMAWMMREPRQKREQRQRIRSFTGGIMVAFLDGCVKNDYSYLNGVIKDPSVAPVGIETPQAYVEDKEKGGLLSGLLSRL